MASTNKKALTLQEWTTSIDKNVKALRAAGQMVVRKHQKSNIKTCSFANDLRETSKLETCKVLKECMSSLAEAIEEGESSRNVIMSQLQSYMVQIFDRYDSKLKLQDVNIKSRNKAVSTFTSAFKEYSNAARGTNQAKIEHTRDRMLDEKKRMTSAEETLNNSVGSFELQRISDMKNYLKKYVQCQIFFFSREIELLSTTYTNICSINPTAEEQNWLSMLKSLEIGELDPKINTLGANTGSVGAPSPSAASTFSSPPSASSPASTASAATSPQIASSPISYPPSSLVQSPSSTLIQSGTTVASSSSITKSGMVPAGSPPSAGGLIRSTGSSLNSNVAAAGANSTATISRMQPI